MKPKPPVPARPAASLVVLRQGDGPEVLMGMRGAKHRFMPNRRRRPKPPKPIQPICGCGHHLAQHDAKKGTCHARISADKYDIERMQCTCRQYSGPLPVPEFFASEIAS